VLDPLAVAGSGRQAGVDPRAGLDGGLLVGADHELARVKEAALEAARIEVEHDRGLGEEVGIGGEEPGAVAPGLDRVLPRSQRRIVDADASEMPRSTTRRWTSAAERRESGAPSEGGSQATAFTWATSSGGKTARATRPRSVLEALEPLLGEASSPAPHYVGVHLQPPGDLGVSQAVRGVEDELGALDVFVGERVAGGAVLKLAPLPVAQDNLVAAASGHRQDDSPPRIELLQRSPTELTTTTT
jgi:hypothetical protein